MNELIVRIVCLGIVLIGLLWRKALWQKFSDTQSRLALKVGAISLVAFALAPQVDITLGIIRDSSFSEIVLFNPYNFFSLVAVIVMIQVVGVILITLYGAKAGLLFVGFVGGGASSTAITQVYALHSKETHVEHSRKYAATAVIANGSSMLHKTIIAAVANIAFLPYILPFLITHFLVGTLLGLRSLQSSFKIKASELDTKYFSIFPLIWFVVILFLVNLLTQIVPIFVTENGKAYAAGVSIVGGLDTTIITISKSFNDVGLSIAVGLILGAFAFNILGKIVYSAVLGNRTYFKDVTIGLLITMLISSIVEILFLILNSNGK